MARARTLVLDTKVKVSGQDQLKALGNRFTDFGNKVKTGALDPTNLLAGAIGGIAAAKTIQFFGDAVNAASDLNETVSKSAQIFGEEAIPGLEKWAEAAAKSMGQSKQQALDGAASFAIFGKSAGLAGDDLVGFSTDLSELASDLASFANTSPEEAITAITAALRGESEPIRRYGVLLDEATLRQKAFELGIISSTKTALKPQQRVLAAQAAIMDQTADAQGDFARTSDGLANQQRILQAELENVTTEIGQALLPAVKGLVHFMAEDGIPVLEAFAEQLGDVFETDPEPDEFVRFAQEIALSWGDMNDAIEDAAEEIGVSEEKLRHDTATNMLQFGEDFDTALQHAKDFNDELPGLLEGAALSARAKWQAELAGLGSDLSVDLEVSGVTSLPESMKAAADAAIAEAKRTPEQIAVELATGKIGVETAANELADLIPAPMIQAALDAVDAVESMPGDIAAAIIDGRDEVNTAANNLAAAVTDPIRNQANIDEARGDITQLNADLADALNNGEPTAAIKAELAQVQIQLAGFLLRADPLSEEAAGLLTKYLEDEDPAVKAAAEAMFATVEERAFIMKNDVETLSQETGALLPDALAAEKTRAEHEAYLHFLSTIPPAQQMADDIGALSTTAAKAPATSFRAETADAGFAARGFATAVRTPLAGIVTEASGLGEKFSRSFADGLKDPVVLDYVRDSAYKVALAARGVFFSSEPKDPLSPLRGWDKVGGNMIIAFADSMLRGIPAVQSAARAVAEAALPRLTAPANPRFFGPGGQFVDDLALNEFPASPTSATGGRVVVNLTVQGDLKASERDLPGHIVRALYASGFVQ